MANQLTDPFRGFRFRVEIAGIQVAAFAEASVPDITVDSVDYREGTDPIYKRPLSGLTSYGRLSLKKGLTDGMDLYNWQQQVSQLGSGSPNAQKNISLILLDTDGSEKVRWNVINAWPTKYETSGMNAASSDVMVETLELAMEYMNRIK
ncbi:phage tail protein [Dyella sp. M7H15-1]|uniref:phage tail protein n=1 Tax=Dyella sp. M7H15-1 TaxID=2501295 RepID=UPI001004EF0F|nr:phage tail protein [Dyella sp. M7H15-1]QAU25018.1 phage tail protein [Dyella sp. M7H15-1]